MMEISDAQAAEIRREMGAFESAWMEASDLGDIDRRAANVVWHAAMGFCENKLTAREAELVAEVAKYREALEEIAYGNDTRTGDVARNALGEG